MCVQCTKPNTFCRRSIYLAISNMKERFSVFSFCRSNKYSLWVDNIRAIKFFTKDSATKKNRRVNNFVCNEKACKKGMLLFLPLTVFGLRKEKMEENQFNQQIERWKENQV